MLLPRMNGEWTEDLSRKVRHTRSSMLLEISKRIHPKFGRRGQTSDERGAFQREREREIRTKLGEYIHHHQVYSSSFLSCPADKVARPSL